MVGMAAVGTLSYNGYTFDGTAKIKCRVEFVYDSADRTISYHKHTITVEAVVAVASGDTDDDLETIRILLSQPAKPFVFVNRGFGDDLIVNFGGSTLKDVNFGPKPRMIEWEPIAGVGAANVTWEVEVCVPVCECGPCARTSGVMSFTYDIDFAIDGGWTERRISGSLRIAQTRISLPAGAPGQIPDNADGYREWLGITKEAPSGFTRKSQFSTSEDKCTLNFTITDTEIRSNNTYPPGVVNIQGRHRASWRRSAKGGMLKLFNRLSASIELMAGVRKVNALLIFASLLQQRIAIAKAGGKGVLLEELEIEEDIWGMPTDFSASYVVLRGIDEILQGTGLFTTPAPSSPTWKQWNVSTAVAHSARGYAQMRDVAGNDALIDLCTQFAGGRAPEPNKPSPTDYPQPLKIKNETPPKEKSYSDFQNAIYTHKEMPAVRQSAAQQPYTTGGGGNLSAGGSGSSLTDNTSTNPADEGLSFPPTQKKQYDDTIQLGGGANTSVMMVGFAERAGYEIQRPKLLAIGDLTAAAGQIVETDVKFMSKQKGIYFGVPVYQAAWAITYMLTNTPSTVKTPNNVAQSPTNTLPPWV